MKKQHWIEIIAAAILLVALAAGFTLGRSANKAFLPGELSQVQAIRVWDRSGSSRNTTDPSAIQRVVSAMSRSSFVGNDREKNDQDGRNYLVYLKLKDGREISLTYWPGGGAPNLADIRRQERWTAPGLDKAMQGLIPPVYISENQAARVARRVDAKADWQSRLVPRAAADGKRGEALLLEGINPAGERLAVYLDPVTGRLLRQDPPEAPWRAAGAVMDYFKFTGWRDFTAAWDLIDPRAQKPIPGTGSPDDLRDAFLHQQTGSKLDKITGAVWIRGSWKYNYTQQNVWEVVELTLLFTDGTEKKIHAARNDAGRWYLFWNPDEGLL